MDKLNVMMLEVGDKCIFPFAEGEMADVEVINVDTIDCGGLSITFVVKANAKAIAVDEKEGRWVGTGSIHFCPAAKRMRVAIVNTEGGLSHNDFVWPEQDFIDFSDVWGYIKTEHEKKVAHIDAGSDLPPFLRKLFGMD